MIWNPSIRTLRLLSFGIEVELFGFVAGAKIGVHDYDRDYGVHFRFGRWSWSHRLYNAMLARR